MSSRRFVAISLASCLAACSALAGCATPADEDDAVSGGAPSEGVAEDAIVSERQLMGNELADKTLSLTFDDGPAGRTAELAQFLAAQGVPATFFINGKNVGGRQAAIDAILTGGHLIANHTQNHPQLTKLSADKVVQEVADTDVYVTRAHPTGPFLIRAPFGAWNGNTARALNATPMQKYVGSIFWDIGGELTSSSAADWACWGRGVSVEECGDLYVNEVHTRRRGIVLFHDVHSKTVDMVKNIVPTLKAEGYKFVPLKDVPSIKRAIGAVSEVSAGADGCSSSSLGRMVKANDCVQSRRDQNWYRCTDGDWVGAEGAGDPACTGAKYGL